MKVFASRGCDVGSKNKDKSFEDADLSSVEVDKARACLRRGASWEKGEGRKRREGGGKHSPWKIDQETGQGRKAVLLRAFSLSGVSVLAC
jgi:hypothetical protein